MKKQRKAYILSSKNGVVQIGNIVYCLPTRESFHATMKGCKSSPYVMVEEKSFRAAEEALRLHYLGMSKIKGDNMRRKEPDLRPIPLK